jgi:aryl-alcohol dehydrogenase-like predicted oxidoreductase
LIRKPLGKSGITLPPVMFGGNVFSWSLDEAAGFRMLDALTEAGLDAIDTADAYTRFLPGHVGGESETIIGAWLKSRGGRDKVVIATKCGLDMGPGKKGLSKAWITTAVEDSLRRLRTDYIDLYQAHRDDPETPLEETLEAFAGLIAAGKVRAIGASNYSAARLAAALAVSEKHGLPRYESLQPEYNLVSRAGYEAELEPLCLAEDIGVIPYYSLAAGFLTGKYRSEADLGNSAARGGTVKRYFNARGLAVVDALREQAARLRATPTQVALAWLIARPSITAPIASATSLAQLEDLVKAASLQLDAEAVGALDEASAYTNS